MSAILRLKYNEYKLKKSLILSIRYIKTKYSGKYKHRIGLSDEGSDIYSIEEYEFMDEEEEIKTTNILFHESHPDNIFDLLNFIEFIDFLLIEYKLSYPTLEFELDNREYKIVYELTDNDMLNIYEHGLSQIQSILMFDFIIYAPGTIHGFNKSDLINRLFPGFYERLNDLDSEIGKYVHFYRSGMNPYDLYYGDDLRYLLYGIKKEHKNIFYYNGIIDLYRHFNTTLKIVPDRYDLILTKGWWDSGRVINIYSFDDIIIIHNARNILDPDVHNENPFKPKSISYDDIKYYMNSEIDEEYVISNDTNLTEFDRLQIRISHRYFRFRPRAENKYVHIIIRKRD